MGDSSHREANVRPGSTPDALSLRLAACSPLELKHVHDLLRFFELSRGLGWVRHCGDARHAASERFHEIREIACGSVRTWCGGSMSVADRFEIEARPALGDRCDACVRLREQRRAVERGLTELVEATEVT